MKKKNSKKWIVAKEISDGDYEVWEVFYSKKECKDYIMSKPKPLQKDFFYFKEN